MCAWLLVILTDNKTVVASPWTSDLSGLPLSSRRAYGRIITSPFQLRDATLKRLSPAPIQPASYALTLTSTNGTSATVYFTRDVGQPLERFEIRHSPTDKTKVGITSVQFIAPDAKADEMATHVYRDRFSTRLSFGSLRDGRATGSLVVVFPDSKRSFVSGAFKARLVGFAQP